MGINEMGVFYAISSSETTYYIKVKGAYVYLDSKISLKID